MSGRSLVSAIIIFHNAEKFIEEAIESVFAQTYVNWELLLVDDGSSDRSTKIAQRYAAHYPDKVHYIEHTCHQNRGMSASRNLGIKHAKGEYIAFLDADDVWLPIKLDEQLTIVKSQPKAGMVYGKTLYWYSWTGKPEDNQRDYVQQHGIKENILYYQPELLSFFLRGKAAIPPPSSIILRREIIESIGGFEEDFLGLRMIYEDQAFYTKLCIKAPVFVSNGCWDKYRQHSEQSCSIAREKIGQLHFARLKYLEWAAIYLSKSVFQDSDLWQTLNRELWLYGHYRKPTSLNFSDHWKYLLRWAKKWILWSEEKFLPPVIRSWIWS